MSVKPAVNPKLGGPAPWSGMDGSVPSAISEEGNVSSRLASVSAAHPLLLIEWVDASRLSNGWMDWGEIPDPYPHRCVTVGFLVSENEHAKILVPTIGDVEHKENRHTYGGMMIPRAAIVSERQIG